MVKRKQREKLTIRKAYPERNVTGTNYSDGLASRKARGEQDRKLDCMAKGKGLVFVSGKGNEAWYEGRFESGSHPGSQGSDQTPTKEGRCELNRQPSSGCKKQVAGRHRVRKYKLRLVRMIWCFS